MGGADVMKLFGHDMLREFGFVAFLAQVGEVEVPQSGGHDLRGGFGGGQIREMAVASENPLFEAPRTTRTFLQHLHVVIGFKNQHVRGADAFQYQLGRVAKISGESNIAARRPQQKSNRVLRIMRNLKRFNHQVV